MNNYLLEKLEIQNKNIISQSNHYLSEKLSKKIFFKMNNYFIRQYILFLTMASNKTKNKVKE